MLSAKHYALFMDRFSEQFLNLSAYKRHVWGDDEPESLDYDASVSSAVHKCANCCRTTDHVYHVPGFEYDACERCYNEAMAILAQEERENPTPMADQETAAEWMMLAKVGMGLAEAAAYQRVIGKKGVA